MTTSHKNILIPIGQSLNTEEAVVEAMKLAKPRQSTIHLVCLMHSWNPFIMIRPSSAFQRMLNDDLDSYLKALINLMRWKDLIEKNCHGILVRIHLKKGFSWESLMQRTIEKVGSGTIILAAGPKRKWSYIWIYISLRLLAIKIGSTVLALKGRGMSVLPKNTLSIAQTNKIPGVGNKEIGAFYLRSFGQSLSQN
jgi:hypothetical protein